MPEAAVAAVAAVEWLRPRRDHIHCKCQRKRFDSSIYNILISAWVFTNMLSDMLSPSHKKTDICKNVY